jgi:SAM-dependent methyltransferase
MGLPAKKTRHAAVHPRLAEPSGDEFRREFESFRALSRRRPRGMNLKWEDRKPCLDDRTENCDFDRHYVYHTGWAARVLATTRPAKHIDISSSLYFASIASAFVPTEFYEFRPANLDLPNLRTGVTDLHELPFLDASVASISCMHVIEHVGLGRYGDELDPDGDLKAMAELKRVIAPDGSLLLVVPVGRPRVVFNAHRIYAFEQVLESFDGMELEQFALVPDGRFNRGLIVNPPEGFADEQNYGCGCFWLRRPT